MVTGGPKYLGTMGMTHDGRIALASATRPKEKATALSIVTSEFLCSDSDRVLQNIADHVETFRDRLR